MLISPCFHEREPAGGKHIAEKSTSIQKLAQFVDSASKAVRGALSLAAAGTMVTSNHGRRHMLKAIIFHLKRILKGILTAPSRMLRSLIGSGAPTPPDEAFEDVVDEQTAELREELDAGPEKPTMEATTLGARIHEYAAGDRDSRGTYDVSGMPDHVGIALLTMPPDQLHRLAIAGPAICERWAAGEKSGLVGVPLPRAVRRHEQAEDAHVSVPEGEALSRAHALQPA